MPLYMRLGKLRGPHMKKSMPIGPFRTYAVPVNVGRLASASRRATRSPPRRSSPRASSRTRARRSRSSAAASSTWRSPCACTLYSRSCRGEDRGGRRQGRAPLTGAGGASREQQALAVAGQRLEAPGSSHEAALHGGDARDLPVRLLRAGAGRRPRALAEVLRRAAPAACSASSTCSRAARCGASAVFALGHHAVHHGVDHHAAAHRGHPQAGGAGQGGRAGPEEDHQVHALAHRRPVARRRRSATSCCSSSYERAAQRSACWRSVCSSSSASSAGAVSSCGSASSSPQRGIGNGMSIIIFISIVSRHPGAAPPSCSRMSLVIAIILFLVIALRGGRRRHLDHRRASAASRCSTPSAWSAGA